MSNTQIAELCQSVVQTCSVTQQEVTTQAAMPWGLTIHLKITQLMKVRNSKYWTFSGRKLGREKIALYTKTTITMILYVQRIKAEVYQLKGLQFNCFEAVFPTSPDITILDTFTILVYIAADIGMVEFSRITLWHPLALWIRTVVELTRKRSLVILCNGAPQQGRKYIEYSSCVVQFSGVQNETRSRSLSIGLF